MSDDFEFEPIPGLPEVPPAGEDIIWQGGPTWTALARQAFHADKIAAYFGLLIALRLFLTVRDGQPLTQALASAGVLVLVGALAVGVIVGLAYMSARSTIYTITNKRVAMRFGIALPLTVNIPLSQVAHADAARRADGVGDISLALAPGKRLAYLVLWPHARAWHLNNPEPTLRSVADVKDVARLLGEVLEKSAVEESDAGVRVRLVRVEPETQAAVQLPQRLQAAE